jgi:hypothetical protein
MAAPGRQDKFKETNQQFIAKLIQVSNFLTNEPHFLAQLGKQGEPNITKPGSETAYNDARIKKWMDNKNIDYPPNVEFYCTPDANDATKFHAYIKINVDIDVPPASP